MNKTIFKYPIQTTDKQIVSMPKGAEILTVQNQNEIPCVWALVNPDSLIEKEDRHFEMFGTGHDIYCDMGVQRKYINSFQMAGGRLVFHVFERL